MGTKEQTQWAARWTVTGSYLDSGEAVEMTIDAPTERDASAIATRRGVAVTSIRASSPASTNAASATRARGEDEVLFQKEHVMVTRTRFVVGTTTYALKNITSVAYEMKKGNRAALGVFAFFAAIAAVAFEANDSRGTAIVAAVVFLILLLSAFRSSPTYHVVLTTNAAQQRALTSKNRSVIKEVIDAIHRAISL